MTGGSVHAPSAPVVLVLASGRGERFRASGGAMHKLDAPLAGRSVLERTLDAVRESGLPWHLERASHAGMGDCIAAAVRATRGAPGWLVLPGDLPLVSAQTLRQVAAALAGNAVVLPLHQGQQGHPVGFDASCGEALASLQGDRGAAAVARAAVESGRALRLEVEDAGVLMDVDTVDDLARAERAYASSHRTV